jgi:acid phosphatase (class A)
VRLKATFLATALAIVQAGCMGEPGAVTPVSAQAAPEGYLSVAEIEALAQTVPPTPRAGSAEVAADIAASDRLRALQGGDRWLLATRHGELRPALALSHFDCALETRLAAAETPRLVALLERVMHDANAAAETAKARAFRPRPVGVDPERVPCQVVSAASRASPSYPSGGATVGAAYGGVFAALAPDRAVQALRTGHEIGVSRAVCAMHYLTDVTAGEALGQAVVRRIEGAPAFRADLAAATEEVRRARATGLTSPACAAERAALAVPLP